MTQNHDNIKLSHKNNFSLIKNMSNKSENINKIQNNKNYITLLYKPRIDPSIKPLEMEFTISEEDIISNNNVISLPFNHNDNLTIMWESSVKTNFKTYKYTKPGVYVVKISGTTNKFNTLLWKGIDKLTKIINFGSIGITNYYAAFLNAINFNSDISDWDVSNVTNMAGMFNNASSFSYDLSKWKVGNVTNMYAMFNNASQFNSNLSAWDVGNVTDMSGMFKGANIFNSELKDWNVKNVVNMSLMFYNATKFKSNLSNWNVGNVVNMAGMFICASDFTSDLSKWNVINVTNMNNMFFGASKFNSELKDWKVNKVTGMQYMFGYANKFNSDISKWNITKVTNMTGIFIKAGLSVENWDKILIGWSSQFVKRGVIINTTIKHSNNFKVTSAFRKLSSKGWNIIEG